MIFPLITIPLTTILFILTFGYLSRSNGKYNTIILYQSTLTTLSKLVTLLSLHINLAYSIIL